MILHYRGDLRGRVEGQTVGPNTSGAYYLIVSTQYDAATGLTTARLRYAGRASC